DYSLEYNPLPVQSTMPPCHVKRNSAPLADLIGVWSVLSRKSGHNAWRKGSALHLFTIKYGCPLLAFPVSFLAVQPLTPGSDTGLAALRAVLTEGGLREMPLYAVLLVLSASIVGWVMRREHEKYEKWVSCRSTSSLSPLQLIQ
ncbi:MAG: hypothetical protein NTU88_11550, partial [Armatimonadetes bacterium]|nr:hypothetical protein [Armatimonadota bacterium]